MGNPYYPKAALRITGVDGGSMNMDGSRKLTLHTTETAPSGFYRKNTYYHIQVREYNGMISWEQAIPFNRASRALRNGPHPIQTNRDGNVHINLAIVGYAKNTPNLSDNMVNALAEFMVWAEAEWGIPARFDYPFGGVEGYGYDGRYRLPEHVYNMAEGVLSHSFAPDTNTHWDVGDLPVDRLEAAIARLKNPPPIDEGDINVASLPTLRLYDGYVSRGKGHLEPDVQTLQGLLAARGFAPQDPYSVRAEGFDGKLGPGTQSALINFQRASGLTGDGVCGPKSWNKLLRV